jgi:hypothetical protein
MPVLRATLVAFPVAFLVGVLFVSMPVEATDNKVASVHSETLPLAAPGKADITDVHGVLFGHPFTCEEALINSISLTLRQRQKIYSRVVINFSSLCTKLPNREFFSEGRLQPRVEVAQRLKNGEKLNSHVYESGGPDYALHIKFGPRQSHGPAEHHGRDDTTTGALLMRFSNGDYVAGTFYARQSPRMIWDDEAVE